MALAAVQAASAENQCLKLTSGPLGVEQRHLGMSLAEFELSFGSGELQKKQSKNPLSKQTQGIFYYGFSLDNDRGIFGFSIDGHSCLDRMLTFDSAPKRDEVERRLQNNQENFKKNLIRWREKLSDYYGRELSIEDVWDQVALFNTSLVFAGRVIILPMPGFGYLLDPVENESLGLDVIDAGTNWSVRILSNLANVPQHCEWRTVFVVPREIVLDRLNICAIPDVTSQYVHKDVLDDLSPEKTGTTAPLGMGFEALESWTVRQGLRAHHRQPDDRVFLYHDPVASWSALAAFDADSDGSVDRVIRSWASGQAISLKSLGEDQLSEIFVHGEFDDDEIVKSWDGRIHLSHEPPYAPANATLDVGANDRTRVIVRHPDAENPCVMTTVMKVPYALIRDDIDLCALAPKRPPRGGEDAATPEGG